MPCKAEQLQEAPVCTFRRGLLLLSVAFAAGLRLAGAHLQQHFLLFCLWLWDESFLEQLVRCNMPPEPTSRLGDRVAATMSERLQPRPLDSCLGCVIGPFESPASTPPPLSSLSSLFSLLPTHFVSLLFPAGAPPASAGALQDALRAFQRPEISGEDAVVALMDARGTLLELAALARTPPKSDERFHARALLPGMAKRIRQAMMRWARVLSHTCCLLLSTSVPQSKERSNARLLLLGMGKRVCHGMLGQLFLLSCINVIVMDYPVSRLPKEGRQSCPPSYVYTGQCESQQTSVASAGGHRGPGRGGDRQRHRQGGQPVVLLFNPQPSTLNDKP